MAPRFRVKSIFSEGMGSNIRYWHMTPNPKTSYLLEIAIGDVHEKKSEVFKVLVVTPEGLRDMAADQIIIRDRATIVVAEYDFIAIEAHIIKIVEACNRPQWSDTIYQLRKYFDWEWEGFDRNQG